MPPLIGESVATLPVFIILWDLKPEVAAVSFFISQCFRLLDNGYGDIER